MASQHSSQGIAIAGVAESDLGSVPGKTIFQLQMEAAKAAIEDAGLEKSDIDGVLTAAPFNSMHMPSMALSEYLGIQPSYSDSTITGGSSFETHVGHAMAAIQAGLCTTCLITYGSTQKSDRSRNPQGTYGNPEPPWQFEAPYGPPLPLAAYAMAARRHMYEFGTTSEQLAEIAVATRKWAALNPKAYTRDPLSIDDVMNSPIVTDPLHRYDCCLVTDGGGAVIVTSLERARDLKKRPVAVLGFADTHSHMGISQMPDLVRTAAGITGPKAFGMAGVKPSDIDVTQIYDSFTITVMLCLEDLGFCAKGEAGAFVSGQRTAPGGEFALNTSGGGLSYCHPGMFGIFLIIEAVRQLRGECGDRQIPSANLTLAHGVGGVLSSHATLILGGE
ncbi:acetyl-CoA acetyltransferase [Oricola indica]|uniref:acetyl-CoA acetyltransferase n=1 Tax=Oricola indica TaxID=2872591 RepID=UPI003CCC25DF